MTVYFTPDGIQATKGELIEFQRQFCFIWKYLHYAVYTADSAADGATDGATDGLVNVQNNRPVVDRK